MIPADKIRLAIINGTSLVCATCTKFHRAAEMGKFRTDGSVQCLATDGCGSPIVGDTFHEYEGPITDFLRFCFVCGNAATKGLAVKGHRRVIGACEKHVSYVVEMTPDVPASRSTEGRSVLSDAGEKEVEKLLPKEKKTLSQMLTQIKNGTFKPDN